MKELSSQELRIGNYVEYGGVLNKVYLLSHIYFQIESTDIPIFKASKNRSARPIPLTEEWLLKFGFEEESNRFYILNNLVVEYREGTKLFNFVADEPIDIIVKYVHQLQNLYFALTGEELTLEP